MDLITAIEKTRRDLLELSARNRLIHTPLETKKPGWIPIVGERSDQLFDILVRQNKAMTFLPQAADNAAAEVKEFRRAFDGPGDHESGSDTCDSDEDLEGEATGVSDSHSDMFLQTTLSSDKLNDKLLKCFYEAKTSEEEHGVSILYLACGFLKWRESPSSTVNRYAPLLLIPVELSRNNARSKFRLKFRDDEIVTNLSIQARLQQDFGIRMPDLPESTADDDNWSPSKYFAEIADLVKEREGWELMSNDIMLWFFSFRETQTMKWIKAISRLMLAALMVGAGVMHFLNPSFFVKIVPPYFPCHRELVAVSGAIEILLGVLLIIPNSSRLAAWGVIALLIAVFPANIYVFQHQEIVPASSLAHLIRLLLQGVLILWAYWHTRPTKIP
ncbi:MAG: DUF4011 domain-containing protein [Phormidesmis sp. CAN_BIN44]|nr:DUF4011 domain-containing protein [Phormidesmis sp. CAN_BIN44]